MNPMKNTILFVFAALLLGGVTGCHQKQKVNNNTAPAPVQGPPP
jgi:hypothetical protein